MVAAMGFGRPPPLHSRAKARAMRETKEGESKNWTLSQGLD